MIRIGKVRIVILKDICAENISLFTESSKLLKKSHSIENTSTYLKLFSFFLILYVFMKTMAKLESVKLSISQFNLSRLKNP